MLRFVVKGRGENRGKYLRAQYSRETNDTVMTWETDRRQASRYNRDGVSRLRVDGYPVKLTCPKSIAVDALRRFIRGRAAKADETLSAHWVHGAGGLGCEEATDYCYECCVAKVAEIIAAHPKAAEEAGVCVDGGWSTEHDSTPSCDTCGAKLSADLTEYGADEELDALTAYAAPSFDQYNGWQDLDNATSNLEEDDPRWRKIAKIVEKAREEERQKIAAQAALAVEEGMAEARTDLLRLLTVRAMQKAPEPSYKLWSELHQYLSLSFEERYAPTKEVKDLEIRLWKEAKSFAALLGYEVRGDTIEAPYGGYIWHFVIQIEQERLWQRTPFLEGKAYMLHPCPSGDPKWPHHRDANPYPAETADHTAWDCGYISAVPDR